MADATTNLARKRRRYAAIVPASVILLLVAVTLIGPLVAPYAYDQPVGPAGDLPTAGHPLGTDALGRDVLSRVLHGGLTIVGLGFLATLLAYIPGIVIGLVSGFRESRTGLALVAAIDVLMALPSIVLMLVVVAGLGPSIPTLLISVVLVQLPSIARLVRVATAQVARAGYVDVAFGRGESMPGILAREVLPNVAHIVFADAGVRFGWSITLIASMNYLGLGLPAPVADWGLMIAENREFISANPWSVLVPAFLLGALTIGVSALLDTYTYARGRLVR